jgi:hypothetical protein
MDKKDIVRRALAFKEMPYVPWHFKFTVEAQEKLLDYLNGKDLEIFLQNHIVELGNDIGFFTDVKSLKLKSQGKLSFWGGLSFQKTLPFDSVNDVINESQSLLEAGHNGGYIFSTSHAAEGDAPVENILAFINEAKLQSDFAV